MLFLESLIPWWDRQRALRSIRRLQRREAWEISRSDDSPLHRAKLALQADDIDGARTFWDIAWSRHPDYVRSAPETLDVALGLQLFEVAEKLMLEGKKRAPRELRYAEGYAEVAQHQARWPEAAERWSKVRKRFPGSFKALVKGCRCLRELRRFDEADALAKRAIALFPREIDAWVEYGLIAEARDDAKGRLERWNRISDHHWLDHAVLGKARALIDLGQLALAETQLAEGQLRRPRQPEMAVLFARVPELRGDKKEALKRWADVRQRFPTFEVPYIEQVRLLKELRDGSELESLVNKAIAQFPDKAWPKAERALLVQQQMKLQEARSDVASADETSHEELSVDGINEADSLCERASEPSVTDADQEILLRRQMKHLPPYSSICNQLKVVTIGGIEHFSLTRSELENLLRHFLRLIPFDEAAYLKTDRELETAIKTGRYQGSPQKHFLSHGYFEGRRPFNGYLPEPLDLARPPREVPSDFFLNMEKADCLFQQCDYERAEELVSYSLKIFPDSFQANRLGGYLAFRMGRLIEASRRLQNAIRAKGDDAQCSDWLANISDTFGLPEMRATYLELAMRHSRASDIGRAAALGDALANLGRLKDAHRAFRHLNLAKVGAYTLASKLRIDSEYEAAKTRIRQLIIKRRRADLAHNDATELAYLLAKLGFSKLAATASRRLLDAEGGSETGSADWFRLIESVRIARGPGAAMSTLESLLETGLEESAAYCYLAELSYRAGNPDKAATILSDRPDAGRTERGLRCKVLSLIQQSKLDEALDTCDLWRSNYPLSANWGPLVIFVLVELRRLSCLHVPSDAPAPRSWPAACLIPARIGQFWNESVVPVDVAAAMSSWERNNPEFEYERFSSISAREYLLSKFGQSAVDAFDACSHPAMQADFFRLGYLATSGGFFVDADEWSGLPLASALRNLEGKSMMVIRTDKMGLFCSPMACRPGHPAFVEMFEDAKRALLEAQEQGVSLDIHQTTGPGLVTRIVASRLLDGSENVSFLEQTGFIHQTDGHRFSREELFAYKQTAGGNWRLS